MSYSIHVLTFPDAPESPCSLLVDNRVIPRLPKPVAPNRSTPLGPDGKPCFEIRSAGVAKGLGMFATRHIPVGALIVVEHPAILSPGKVLLEHDSRATVFRELFTALPEKRQAELRTMTNCRNVEECTMEEGISWTNGTEVGLGLDGEIEAEARDYGAVFLIINRSNHSCGPNAAHQWDLASFSSSLYALRAIAPGEEITMIYTDVTESREKRRGHLLSHYRFLCQCAFCVLTTEEAIESDINRAALRDWRHTRPTYTGWATDLCRSDDFVLKSHMEALSLIRKEGLEGLASTFLRDVCLCWALLGEEDQFREWGKKLEALADIRDPEMASEMREWLENPRKVPKWGWRKKQRTEMNRKKVKSSDELDVCCIMPVLE